MTISLAQPFEATETTPPLGALSLQDVNERLRHSSDAPTGSPIMEQLFTIASPETEQNKDNAYVVVSRQLAQLRQWYAEPSNKEDGTLQDTLPQETTPSPLIRINLLGSHQALYEQGIDTHDQLFLYAENFIQGIRTPQALAAAKFLTERELTYIDCTLAELYEKRYQLEKDPINYTINWLNDFEDKELNGRDLTFSEQSGFRDKAEQLLQETAEQITHTVRRLSQATSALRYVNGYSSIQPFEN
jgi:hypothetical protein